MKRNSRHHSFSMCISAAATRQNHILFLSRGPTSRLYGHGSSRVVIVDRARSSQLWALMRVMYQTDFVRVRFGGPLAWQNVFTIIHATFPFLFVLTLPLADPLQRLLLLHTGKQRRGLNVIMTGRCGDWQRVVKTRHKFMRVEKRKKGSPSP
ncbi:hypothetical protein OUZ56_001510 [Daphnia magna]|uniref:Uncharacterized protein n=1 Tax=Daphnia magna TaxID=35525 RepID=A0ABR0A3E7_9CRUS|nr:hypothetical protein OUZ56_001510 [Daphnia magna]